MGFTIGSLFDGSGGFPLAATMCGGTPMWAAEVEPYPIAVTKSRFPNMKHLGDVSKVNGAEIEPVDVITFGSPCQDLSVAGKRAGLKHEENGDEETTRSGLFMEAVRIIKEMRKATNGVYPTFALWENVPGAFSSSKGEDFRIVLEELIKIVEPTAVMPPVPQGGWPYADSYCGDGWSIAYRVLDAQFWGVPQRRRRIYLVADFRGGRAREVSFEREGLRRYFAESGTQGETVAPDAERGFGTDDCTRTSSVTFFDAYQHHGWRENNVSGTLTAGQNGTVRGDTPLVCVATQQGGAEIRTDDKAPTITAAAGMSGNNQPWIVKAAGFKEHNSSKARSDGYGEEVSPCLSANNHDASVCYTLEPGIAAREGGHVYEGVSGTLRANAGDNQMAVAYSFDSLASNSMKSSNPHSGCREVQVSKTLDTTYPDPSKNQGGIAVVEPIKCYDIGEARLRTPSEYEEQSPTITARCGTGGNNVPAVVYKADDGSTSSVAPTLVGDHNNRVTDYTALVVCLQGNGIDRADTAGCNGKGWTKETSYTLNTIDRHAVAYLASGKETTGTLMANAGTKLWLGNQEAFSGDYHIIEESEVYRQGGFGDYVEGECGTLRAAGGDYGGGSENLVTTRYIVRRLTPTECARLQGFPDKWGHPDKKDEFTDEEYRFWLDVRNTHAAINGKAVKDYTKEQILSWYNKLHTDSSEYKMWGNGIALPCALYVMQGIAEVL